ncbi:hypothetical protein ACHAWF_006213 [Thalassiosira exigua]
MVAKSTRDAAPRTRLLLLLLLTLVPLVAYLGIALGAAERGAEAEPRGRSPRVELPHLRNRERPRTQTLDRTEGREPSSRKQHASKKGEREAPRKVERKVYLVGIDPSNPATLRHEMQHLWLEGITRSDRLELTTDPTDGDAHWIYSFFVGAEELKRDLASSEPTETSATRRKSRSPSNSPRKAYLLDMTDYGMPEKLSASLPLVADAFGVENVYYATRRSVEGRNAMEGFVTPGSGNDTTFFHQGTLHSVLSESMLDGLELQHPVGVLHYGVRTDVVRTLRDTLSKSLSVASGDNTPDNGTNSSSENLIDDGSKIRNENGSDGGRKDRTDNDSDDDYNGSGSGISADWWSLPRTLDVASFWPPSWTSDPIAGRPSRLRAEVSRTVESLGTTHGLNVTVGVVGKRSRAGRFGVSDAYARALLEHKIVVVAQRDEYEGHYRLMEALAGGAMVMTDPMHPLPYKLEDGDGVVVYESLGDLRRKILHYLERPNERARIAKRGWEVSMRYHRSWHVVERLVLGDWMENAIAVDAARDFERMEEAKVSLRRDVGA